MRAAALIVLAACSPVFAPVVAHAPAGHQLSLAANVRINTQADGGDLFDGALPDGGAQWLARDGDQREVRIGAVLDWLDLDGIAKGQTTVPATGVTVHIFADGGYAYE
jgi:hypothetical protein